MKVHDCSIKIICISVLDVVGGVALVLYKEMLT